MAMNVTKKIKKNEVNQMIELEKELKDFAFWEMKLEILCLNFLKINKIQWFNYGELYFALNWP